MEVNMMLVAKPIHHGGHVEVYDGGLVQNLMMLDSKKILFLENGVYLIFQVDMI